MDESVSTDTIAGLATAPGKSPVAAVRVSGTDALSLLENIFTPSSSETDEQSFGFSDGTLTFGSVRYLPCRVFRMKAPHSYTREDVVEFHIPGSPLLAELLLEYCRGMGIRMPEPGEFTKRAYLNGRIDLVRAMGVMEMISASGSDQLKGARNLLFGGVSELLGRAEEIIRNIISLVELNIDFTDQNLDLFETENSYRNLIKDAKENLQDILNRRLVNHSAAGEAHVVIAGMVNAGKSSLFNTLLGFERSAVSDKAGTTRDIIRGKTEIKGHSCVFYDTAGLSDVPDLFEHRARELIRDCGYDGMFMLLCVAPEMSVPDNLLNMFLENPGPEHTLIVRTKSDLGLDRPVIAAEKISSCFGDVFFSAGDTEQTEILQQKLSDLISSHTTGDRFYLSGMFEHALTQCISILETVKDMDIANDPELIAEELREALFLAGEFCHDDPGDEILNTIFSRFCIGK